MSNLAIRVENLGKMFRIGGPQKQHQNFRELITSSATAPFRRVKNLMSGQAYGAADLEEEIWALQNVSFEVKQGDVVGIIGHNGAGKSTLLKVLSRITEPSAGYVDIYGRVGALLEVGTGFHLELTGRENVFLNGAILGMKRQEIENRFDEIVDFAEVEKFIDTPVKHYSSGMRLRLGFAVAAHLEPEILVIDEVLAVGDMAFQRKCIGKMEDVAGKGRTVLFVSHNMAAVSTLCKRGILLDHGEIVYEGGIGETVAAYVEKNRASADAIDELSGTAMQVSGFEIPEMVDGELKYDQPFTVELFCKVNEELPRARLNFIVTNAQDDKVIHVQTDTSEIGYEVLKPGTYRITLGLPPMWLSAGVYTATVKLRAVGTVHDQKVTSPHLPIMISGTQSNIRSALLPDGKWSIEEAALVEG